MKIHEETLLQFRKTWYHARTYSPFYRSLLPEVRESDITPELLSDLPIIRKADLVERIDQFRTSASLPAYALFTSGTTGPPLMVYGSESDLELVHGGGPEAAGRANGRRRRHKPSDLRLYMAGSSQGFMPMVPGRTGCVAIPLQSRTDYDWAWRLLNQTLSFEGYGPRIKELAIPTPALKKLVHYILENELNTRCLALDRIIGFAWYASSRWRRKIEETLGAPFTDIYGCTELLAARAVQEPGDDYYFFREGVIWEVVDLVTERPIDEGYGKLLLTPLYPYSKDAPLFRYEIGDIVELGPSASPKGERGIRPRGRISHTIRQATPGGMLFPLFPLDVQELLDTHPWVARFEDVRQSDTTTTTDDAFPKWRLLDVPGPGPRKIRLEIEMKSSPQLFLEEWTMLKDALHAALCQINPMLARVLDARLLELEIVGLPPGRLARKDLLIC